MPLRAQTTREQIEKHELSAIERRRVITIDEAARLTGLHPDTLLRRAKQRKAPAVVRLSLKRIGMRLGEVIDWIDGLPAETDAPAAEASRAAHP
jgi:predicted DNA-binding transcriptional regulator AlpA